MLLIIQCIEVVGSSVRLVAKCLHPTCLPICYSTIAESHARDGQQEGTLMFFDIPSFAPRISKKLAGCASLCRNLGCAAEP